MLIPRTDIINRLLLYKGQSMYKKMYLLLTKQRSNRTRLKHILILEIKSKTCIPKYSWHYIHFKKQRTINSFIHHIKYIRQLQIVSSTKTSIQTERALKPPRRFGKPTAGNDDWVTSRGTRSEKPSPGPR